ncbi:MAG: hypothetical protein K0B16_08515 [Burkholderiaceae bacterium]|nr:hypothetical protein [Burkholderiaceae bacterium]
MNLLCLIRFVPGHTGPRSAIMGCDRFEARLPAIGAAPIHREGLQLLVRFQNIASALTLLSATLENAVDQGHAISAGLAQGIRSSATVATSLSGFTEGSIAALFEIAAAAGRQQVAISQKLSSFVALSAPQFESRFQPGSAGDPKARIRMPLVMTPLARGRSTGSA